MNILLFSSPGRVEDEHRLVESLFRMGLQRFHLRKPDWSVEELVAWLEALDPQYLDRVVLHDAHSLAEQFGVGGVHLNRRCPELTPVLQRMHVEGRITVSRSCHSIAELAPALEVCDYVTLSPIFDSISKEGYMSAYSADELRAAVRAGKIDSRVYALGGVDWKRLPELRAMGFASAAVLGAVWEASDPVEAFREMLT